MHRRLREALVAVTVGGLALTLLLLVRGDADHTLAQLGVATVLALVLVGLVGDTRDVVTWSAFGGAAVFWLGSVAHTAATSGVAFWLADGHLADDGVPFPGLASLGGTVAVLALLVSVGSLVWSRLGADGRAEVVARARELRRSRGGPATD